MAVSVITKTLCGFCNSGNHRACVIGTKHQGRHERYPKGVVWACQCTSGGCSQGRRKCANCGNRVLDEVNPETWECFDIAACHAVVENRRTNDPFFVQLREIKERVKMAKVQETQEKAEKVAKTKEPTYCLVTGEQTKGGLFKPGMDARYVSERVAAVTEAGFTAKAEKEQRSKMKSDGVSERLIAKFDKSLGLAREKVEKKKAAAEAKAAEKAEAASA